MTTATATQLGTAGIQSILDKIAEYGVTTTLPVAADITRIDVDGGDVTIHTATDTYDVALNSDMEMDFLNLRLNALSIINFDDSVPADQFDVLVHDGTGFAPAPQSELDIEWTQLNNIPTEFTPEAHTHPISDITDLQTELDGKSDTGHTHVKADITDLNEADYATAAQGATADSATQPGDNISTLTNDSNFIDASGAPVQSVNGYTGTVTLGQSDVGLANVNNTSDLNKPISTATQTALDGKADLVGGKLSNSQVPDLAISNFLGSVSNESAMLALSGQAGDWALRTDTDVMYILVTTGGSTLSDWQSISYPTAPVQTVNGQTGNVVLAASDVNALAASDIGVTVQGYDADTVIDANYVATDENFTTADHAKLDGIAAGAEVNVQANWTETDSGLDSFIQNKPTLGTASAEDSTAFATAAQGTTADSALQPGDIGVTVQGYNANTVIDGNYVATDENFTTTLKNKLDGIAIGAEVNVNADWNAVSGDAEILNKPTLGTAAAADTTDFADATHFHVKADITDFSDADYAAASHTHTLADITDSGTAAGLDVPATGDAATSEVVKGDDSRLTDSRDPNAHTHDTSDITTGTFANARIAQGNVTQYQGNLAIDWSQLTSVPSVFTPDSHTHPISDITNLQTELDGKIDESREGVANGIATLDSNGTVPSSQLPSYVDDILEYANEASFPATGETGKLYVDLSDNSVHRWSGSAYVNITDYSTPGHTHVKADITDFSDSDYATAAQGTLADSATQPGDNVSTLTNDANYITSAGAPVQSVNGQTGTVSLASDDLTDVTITSAQAGDAIVYDGAGFVNAAPTVIIDVHNDSGSTITKATPVYVSGTHTSGKPTIALADSNGASTYPAIGLVYADVANGADGRVMVSGVLTNLDTNTPGYSAGDALYVSSTAGDLTNTRPTASSEKVQKVALCTRAHVSSGSILVMGAGRTNDVNNELTALTGVALNATDLGTFTGTTATDNSDIKTVLQDLETAVEGKADTSHTHATTDITSGTFADARIAQSNVTQHEGALSVDWTQLTSVPSTFAPSAHTHTLSEITDAGTSASLDVAAIGDAAAGQVVKGNDSRLTDARTPTSHTHPISDITNLQTTLDGKAASDIDIDTVASNGNTTSVDVTVGHNFTIGGHSANADIRLNGDGAASITFDTDTVPGASDVAGLYRIDASGNSERFLTATDNETIVESEGAAGKVILRGSKNGAGDIFTFAEFGWNDTSINGPVTIRNAAGTDLYTLPTADGTANQIIQTDGSGTLSFVDAPTGGGGASIHKEWVGRSTLSSSEDTHYMLPGGFATGLSDDIPYEINTLSTIAAVAKGHGHVVPAGTYSGTISLETAVGNSSGSSGSIPYDGGSLEYYVYRTSYSGSTATWNQVATGTITCAANSEEFVNTDITITSETFAAGERLHVVLKGVESISATTYFFWGYSADLTED